MAASSKADLDPWVAGWAAGAGAVAVAAGLLVTITALARRVASQADDIREAIEATCSNVEPLLQLPAMNVSAATLVERVRDPGVGSEQ